MVTPRNLPAGAPAGFSLAELLTAVAVVGVLAAIGSSLVGGFVHAARAAEARAAVLDTYRAAVGHSATRGTHVVACPARDGRCIDGIDWSGGWLLFEDRDGDRQRDDNERAVRSWPTLATGVRLRSTVGRKRLVFQPSGGNAGSNVTFTLCDGPGADDATQLVIANDGRLREVAAPGDAAASCAAGP